MNHSFAVALTEDQYVKAATLLNTPSATTWINARLVTALLVLAAVFGPVVFLRQGSMSLTPFIPVGLFAGLLAFFHFAMPARLRRLYSQQQDLHQTFAIDVNEDTITFSSPSAHSTRPWSKFVRWVEDSEFIVLYLTDVQICVLPKAQIGDHEVVQAVRSTLIAAKVPLARGRNIYAILAFFLILWLGFLLAIELGGFTSYP